MRQVSELLPTQSNQFPVNRPVVREQPRAAMNDGDPVLEAMKERMVSLFTALKAFYTSYGASLKEPKIEAKIQKQWAEELIRAKVNGEMLRKGVERAKRYSVEDKYTKWPVVAEFIMWCYGLPSVDEAYREAVDHSHDIVNWVPSHAAVYAAGKQVSWHKLRRSDTSAGQNAYRKAYMEICARVVAGEQIEANKPQLIEQKKLTESEVSELKAVGRARLRDVRAELGLSSMSVVDYRRAGKMHQFKARQDGVLFELQTENFMAERAVWHLLAKQGSKVIFDGDLMSSEGLGLRDAFDLACDAVGVSRVKKWPERQIQSELMKRSF